VIGCGPVQAPPELLSVPNVTASQCTNFILLDVALSRVNAKSEAVPMLLLAPVRLN